jgi:hypothetical protein
MSFSVHTFETHPENSGLAFAFHENLSEGQDIFFRGKFPEGTVDANSVAESIFGAIIDSLKILNKGDCYDRFEDALKSANMEFKKNIAKIPAMPDIVISYFDFNNLYLSQSGKAEAYLLRNESLSQISETPDSDNELFLNILSGQVSVDDIVIISNDRLLHAITTTQLIDIFSKTSFDEAITILRNELQMKSENDLVVTTIGIGKKSNTGTVGFLSRMVSKISTPKTLNKIYTPEQAASETISEKTQENEENFAEKTKDACTDEQFKETSPSLLEAESDNENGTLIKPSELKNSKLGLNNLRNLKNKLPNFSSESLPPKKKLIKIAGIILGVLVLLVAGKTMMGYESEETQISREELSIAREAIQQADIFLTQGERELAADLLNKAKTSLQKVLNSKSSFRFDAQVLLSDIQEKQLQVENAHKVQAQVLADLATKNDNISATGLLKLRENLFAYDSHFVYKTIRNIVEKGISISDKESIISAALRENQNTLLFMTDVPRIIEYKNGVISPMSTLDETWKHGLDIETYGARYAYILDPVENQIWKYERRKNNYSGATAYNQGADLSRAISFAIDGALYVLSDDGTIQKLFRGEKQDFSFRDMPSTPISGKNLKLYTSIDLDYLYILDPVNTRVLIFTKGEKFATYKKQVIYGVQGATDFVVDSSGQKVSLITSDKIYEFSL